MMIMTFLDISSKSKERNKLIDESTELQEGQEIQRTSATFALEGEYVKNMKDKNFEVKAFKTVARQDLDNPGQLKEKLILTIQLGDGNNVEYYPNGTSQKVIINSGRGYNYKDWIGFKGRLITKSQRVGNADKEVIYIEKI